VEGIRVAGHAIRSCEVYCDLEPYLTASEDVIKEWLFLLDEDIVENDFLAARSIDFDLCTLLCTFKNLAINRFSLSDEFVIACAIELKALDFDMINLILVS